LCEGFGLALKRFLPCGGFLNGRPVLALAGRGRVLLPSGGLWGLFGLSALCVGPGDLLVQCLLSLHEFLRLLHGLRKTAVVVHGELLGRFGEARSDLLLYLCTDCLTV